MLGKHFRLDDQANPRAGLAQLFKTDAELVSEVRATFGGTGFFVIRRRRSPAAHQLPSDVASHSRVRQRINDFTDSRSKANKPVYQLIGRHGRSPKSICNSHFSIFNFQFGSLIRISTTTTTVANALVTLALV